MNDRVPENAAGPRPRLSAGRFLADVADELFSLDRGLPWTFVMLFRDPRAVVRGYIEGRDTRATRPLRYFLVVAIGVTLLGQLLEQQPRRPMSELIAAADAASAKQPAGPNALQRDSRKVGYALGARMSIWTRYYTDRMLLALMPFLAAGLIVAFARQGFNFAEHWVVAMYGVAQLYLVGGVAARLGASADPAAVYAATAGVAALYFWICASVYDGGAPAKIARSAFALLVAVFLLLAALFAYAATVVSTSG